MPLVQWIAQNLTAAYTANVADTVTLAAAALGAAGFKPAASSNASLSESLTGMDRDMVALTEAATLANALAAHASFRTMGLVDTFSLSDSAALRAAFKPSAADILLLSNSVQARGGARAALADATTLMDSLAATKRALVSVADTLAVGDSLAARLAAAQSLDASVGLATALSAGASYAQPLSDSPSLSNALAARWGALAGLAESAALAESKAAALSAGAALADSVPLANAMASRYQGMPAPAEAVPATHALAVRGAFGPVPAAETVATVSALGASLRSRAQLAESASVSDADRARAAFGASPFETLVAADRLAATGTTLGVARVAESVALLERQFPTVTARVAVSEEAPPWGARMGALAQAFAPTITNVAASWRRVVPAAAQLVKVVQAAWVVLTPSTKGTRMAVYAGTRLRLTGTFRDIAGDLADPSRVSLALSYPPASLKLPLSYTYGVDTSLVRDSAGLYHLDFLALVPGRHAFRWASTSAGQESADEASFTVLVSGLAPR